MCFFDSVKNTKTVLRVERAIFESEVTPYCHRTMLQIRKRYKTFKIIAVGDLLQNQ